MAIYVTQFNVFRDTQISQDFFFLENNLREVLHIAENQLGLIDNFNNKCILTYLICHTIWISFDKIIFIQYNKSKTNMRSGYLLFVHSWFYEVWSRSTCNFNQYPCLNNIHLEKVHVLFIWKCLKYGLKECKRAYSDCFTLYMIVWKRQLRFCTQRQWEIETDNQNLPFSIFDILGHAYDLTKMILHAFLCWPKRHHREVYMIQIP